MCVCVCTRVRATVMAMMAMLKVGCVEVARIGLIVRRGPKAWARQFTNRIYQQNYHNRDLIVAMRFTKRT